MPRSPEGSHLPEQNISEQEDPREQRAGILAAEVTTLYKNATTKEDLDLVVSKLKQIEKLYEAKSLNSIEIQEAREILGEDMLGPEAVREAFGVHIEEDEIPELLYSREDLEKAKELGEMLVLRVHSVTALPLTIQRIEELIQPKMTEEEGQLLFDQDWYDNEEFYKEATTKNEWKLVSKDLVPFSVDQDYIEQTKVLRDHLAAIGALSDEELENCSDEKLDEIKEFMDSDYDKNWPEASKRLQELLVNQNHRRTAVEALYDWVLKFKNSGERLLESEYDWTNTRSSDGSLVDFGYAGTGGANVGRGRPRYSSALLGVVSVR